MAEVNATNLGRKHLGEVANLIKDVVWEKSKGEGKYCDGWVVHASQSKTGIVAFRLDAGDHEVIVTVVRLEKPTKEPIKDPILEVMFEKQEDLAA